MSSAVPEARHAHSLPGSPLQSSLQLTGRSPGARALGARQIAPSSKPIAPRNTTLPSTSSFLFPQPPLRSNLSASSTQPTSHFTSPVLQQTKPVTPLSPSSPPIFPASQFSSPPQPPTFLSPLQPQSSGTSRQQPTAAKPNYNIALRPATFTSPSAMVPASIPPLSSATNTPQIPSQPQQPAAFLMPLQPQQRSDLPRHTGKAAQDFSGFDPLL